MKKQQIALKNRVLLSWRLTDKYVLKRTDYGNWLYLIRGLYFSLQAGILIGTLYLIYFMNTMEFFYSTLIFKMPLVYSFASVILSYIAAQIAYQITQYELWGTHFQSVLHRTWKSFLFYIITIYYTILQMSPLSFEGTDISVFGLQNNFTYLYTQYNCGAEQLAYSLLSVYVAQFIWTLISFFIPNFLQLIFGMTCFGKKEKIIKRQMPFKVLEETYPIIILNMIGSMIIPIFPPICLINAILHLILFGVNWQVVIKMKYQNFSSSSRQFMMRILVQFSVLANILALLYFAIMCYQTQGDYFQGGIYANSSSLRVCGPIQFNTTVSAALSDGINQLKYVNYVIDILSWVPLLWVVIIFFYCLEKLECRTKVVWRNEYFVKSRESENIKSYFQQRIKAYEEQMTLAHSEITNLDTPMAKNSGQTVFFDLSPVSILKSKFAADKQSIATPVNSNVSQHGLNTTYGNFNIINDLPSTQTFDESKHSILPRNNPNSPQSQFKLTLNTNIGSNASRFKPN